ncbi:hypothetical protein [Gryllotalpicola protaetiae]|uniref:Uncharacterized protein n=1 Tax=Gryllotalpicola protaetiae TaxID=2419771 RepID=A0A387BGM6_9MICO|nr:hypothetical protein [Gryllotalpicola protaetiae]AYG03073.1 hypothetical protein D7I44_05715 [Gryllotalpicola protaetiae]
MALFGKARPRPIADFDMGLDPGWQGVDAGSQDWPASVAGALGLTAAQREPLEYQLGVIQSRVAELDELGSQSLVWIPETAPDHVRCTLTMAIRPRHDAGPESYAAVLAAEEADGTIEQSYDVVRSWTAEVDAGPMACAYYLITYAPGGEEVPHSEARAVYRVFPPQSSEDFEIVFSTQDLADFADFVEVTTNYLTTLTVVLGK